MDLLWIVVTAVLGIIIGALAAVAIIHPSREAKLHHIREKEVDRSGLEVLGVLTATIILIDSEGEVLRASPEAYSFGLVRNDALVQDEVRAMVREVRTSGHVQNRVLNLSRSTVEGSGRLRLEVRAASLRDDIVLIMINDTTEKLRLEETRRDFVANVSHELKTPVGAIGLLAETVLECSDEPDTVRHFAHRMQVESQRLSSLVRDIIDLSRLQEPDALRDPESVDLSNVIREAVDSVRVAASQRRISIVTGQVPDVQVYGDRKMLMMAVRNLLDNAVRHSYEASRVSVGISTQEETVRIAVVDQGEGIAPEHLGRLFERFYRADPARSRETGGTGLGLSIVKHVVSDHGGRVDVWSAPGKGSTFTIILPTADVPETSMTPTGGEWTLERETR